LRTLLRSHQQLYNAALQERIDAWQMSRVSIGFFAESRSLTEIGATCRNGARPIAPASR
jgi:putative transposase